MVALISWSVAQNVLDGIPMVPQPSVVLSKTKGAEYFHGITVEFKHQHSKHDDTNHQRPFRISFTAHCPKCGTSMSMPCLSSNASGHLQIAGHQTQEGIYR